MHNRQSGVAVSATDTRLSVCGTDVGITGSSGTVTSRSIGLDKLTADSSTRAGEQRECHDD